MNLARPAGSPIGFAAVLAGDLDLPNSISIIYGTITVADPAKVAADPAPQRVRPGCPRRRPSGDLDDETKAPAGAHPDLRRRRRHAGRRLQARALPARRAERRRRIRLLLLPRRSSPSRPRRALPGAPWSRLTTRRQRSRCGPSSRPRRPSACTRATTARTQKATVSGVATELGQPKAGLTVFVDADGRSTARAPGPVQNRCSRPVLDAAGRHRGDRLHRHRAAARPDGVPGGLHRAGRVSEPDRLGAADKDVTLMVPLLTDAKRVLKAADRAAAARVNLMPTDFPAGWTTRTIGPDDFTACSDFQPDESALTDDRSSPTHRSSSRATFSRSRSRRRSPWSRSSERTPRP